MKWIIFLIILVTAQANKERTKRQKFTKLTDANAAYQTYRKPNIDQENRPNIVLILTDDQDTELGSLQFMPKLSKHMRKKGATYEHGYVSTPMCCPSRSSLLTGLYVHNHHVFTNNDNCSSSSWIENHEKRTFATYLQQSGYRTAYYGKYLNKYDGNRVPPGWDEWNGLVKNSQFYNYTLNYNGVKMHHGNDYGRDYLPDLITNRSLQFISSQNESPFLAVLSYPAPHGPEDSAPQYQDLFFNVSTHHTPAYDFAPNPDKQWILRNLEKMLPIQRSFTDMLMTKRLQTLQSVDTGVEKVVRKLKKTGHLRNTYIFYTSDHGYHLGQFGLVKGKAFPFDFDTKVPFIVRGPGITKRSVRSQPVLNIDLAPTFLDLAGLEKPPHMDGKSILPTFRNQKKKLRNSFLIERGKMTFERYAALSQNSVLKDENWLLLKKKKLSKQERLEVQCRKPRYQSPCSLSQKWVCKEREDGTKKISRCHGKNGNRNTRKKMNKCHCQPGEIFGWKYVKLDLDEKKMQKKFLKQNLKLENLKTLKPKFLKTIPNTLSRHGRSTEENLLVESMMDDMAEEEIKEVDLLVEDIAEEIRDLNTLKNSTGCKMAAKNVICESSIMENESEWLSSRSTIKQQINQLRSQLKELKQIRKYLGKKKPNSNKEVISKTLKTRMGNSFPFVEQESEACVCDIKKGKSELKAQLKAEREALRMERKMDKLRRKERKRIKSERRGRRKRKRHEHCKSDVKLNCFSHDNDHWRTPPLWTEGSFCACTNSNNNTYWCVRNINSTANYLYCEYVTGMMTYFDLTVDPHQLRNLLHTLTEIDERMRKVELCMIAVQVCSNDVDLPYSDISSSISLMCHIQKMHKMQTLF
jgi:extracellular sulfatase Sulf